MTNKYLEKIAATKEKKKSQIPAAIGASAAGGFTASAIGGAMQLPLAMKVLHKVDRHSDSGADLHTVRKYMKDNGLHKTTTFNTRHHSVERSSGHGPVGKFFKATVQQHASAHGPAFVASRSGGAKKDFVVGMRGTGKVSKNADVLMHEIGHAKDFQRYGKIKSLSALTRVPGVAGGATLAALSNEKTRDYAPAVAAIPGLLTLREEGAANYHAYKGIKAHKGSVAANRFVRKFLPSQMGSYAIGAATPVAGAYIAKKIMDKWHPKKDSK